MNVGVISMRYAKALYQYAKELKVEDAIYKNMLQLKLALRMVKELPVVLKNPSLTFDEKVTLICDAVIEPSPVFSRFAALIVRLRREDLLLYMAYGYITVYRKDKRVLALKITTATPLPDNVSNRIVDIIEREEDFAVELENAVESSIIGGFICEANSVRLGASVSKQLDEIRKQLVESSRKLV